MMLPGSDTGHRVLAGVRWWPALAALAFVTAPVSGCRPGRAAAPARHEVEIRQFEFRPDTLRVGVGDTVVWINRDIVAHTATDSAGAWDSGEIAKDGRWAYVPRAPGEWAYICALHPTMKGRLIVE
ncbi:MAG TPA: cupredoxin family copper-binding protein [Longimicrobiales bacterium]